MSKHKSGQVAEGWTFTPLKGRAKYAGLVACKKVTGNICPKAATHIADGKGNTLCGITFPATREDAPKGHVTYGLNFVQVDEPNKAGVCGKCDAKANPADEVPEEQDEEPAA